jgi:Domain of unknown function (DUF4350)
LLILFSTQTKVIGVTVVLVILFGVGLTQLFLLRFEAGDVYPAYSSLRTDPLGSEVLFESLGQIQDSSPLRNFRPPDQVKLTTQTTFLVCGLHSNDGFLRDKRVRTLMEHVAASGGRLVLTFSTLLRKHTEKTESDEEDQDHNCSQPSDSKDNHDETSREEEPEQWGGVSSLGFGFEHYRRTPVDDTASSVALDNNKLPVKIPWRTTLYFDLKDAAWQTLYTWEQKPVVVQRSWGRGSIVMSAGSYLFSNEALRNHRSADLLAWVVVPGHIVIFDEFHHGLSYRPGIATLARQYRLHGVFLALLVVAALLGWRQAVVFVPPSRGDGGGGGPAMGLDTGQGLVDLARRHIQPLELLSVCFDAWQPHRDKRVPDDLVAQVKALVQEATENPKQNDPVKIYRLICELLKQGKRS